MALRPTLQWPQDARPALHGGDNSKCGFWELPKPWEWNEIYGQKVNIMPGYLNAMRQHQETLVKLTKVQDKEC